MDGMVETGIYANRSDVVRDAVRRLVLSQVAGIIPDSGDSVKDIRKLRKKLSKEKFDLRKINQLVE